MARYQITAWRHEECITVITVPDVFDENGEFDEEATDAAFDEAVQNAVYDMGDWYTVDVGHDVDEACEVCGYPMPDRYVTALLDGRSVTAHVQCAERLALPIVSKGVSHG